jgi:hypothetical protein
VGSIWEKSFKRPWLLELFLWHCNHVLSQEGHTFMKLKTMCILTLLPLVCYILRIIQNFIIFFRAIKPVEVYCVNSWVFYSFICSWYSFFVIISAVVVQNGEICNKLNLSNVIIILWYAANTFSILYIEKIW